MQTKGTFWTIVPIVVVAIGLSIGTKPIAAQEVAKSKPNNPDVRIKVNKEFDDKGNITRFDSTYSYSWSGNGQIPADADSIVRRFNQKFSLGGSIDSVFSHFGFSDPFDDDPFFNHSFSHSNKHFEEFFKGWHLTADSLVTINPDDFFSRNYREMLKNQQHMMDQFFQQFHRNEDSKKVAPCDSTPLRIQRKDSSKPEKLNYPSTNKTDKRIII